MGSDEAPETHGAHGAHDTDETLSAQGWQPVRILHELEMTRSRGFPSEQRDPAEMRRWCERHFPDRHRATRDAEGHHVFWFRQPRDAQRFALHWFPWKCS